MSRKPTSYLASAILALSLPVLGVWYASGAANRQLTLPAKGEPRADTDPVSPADPLEQSFTARVRPFLQRYCFSCHGAKKREADLDLSRETNRAALAKNMRQWDMVRARLKAKEMPPEDAPRQPKPDERATVIAWLDELHEQQARENAGDPGPVLARRLSNAEFDYTIRDLTGVELRPTREFPIDPANEAGFDNSGESLVMSPALLKKYLAAARRIADHVVLKPHGFVFAPHPVVTDTDRDKYCVHRILDFYARHKIDLVNYFLAAWKYRYRQQLGRPAAELSYFAGEAGLSAKYLALVWSSLTDGETPAGPLAAVRKRWNELPAPDRTPEKTARLDCERLRDLVICLRGQLTPNIGRLHVKGISAGSQPLVLWHNRQLASQHRSYSGEVSSDIRKLSSQLKGKDAVLAELLATKKNSAENERRLRGELERFCAVFPDTFVVIDRGPYFDPKGAGQGRPLTAGFHLMQGYFRDDQPLCQLILNESERREIDELWHELNFIAQAPIRQYKDFIFFERAEPPRFMFEAEFDFARSEDKDATSEAKMNRLAQAYLAKARKKEASVEAQEAIESYFAGISAEIRQVERDRLAADPSHLEALFRFTERAYRRPLSKDEKAGVLVFYRKLRKEEELGHEEALRDTLVSVLLSPHFCYRFDLAGPGVVESLRDSNRTRGASALPTASRPLSNYELASRMSYFLWSSMPDAELLALAAKGDLRQSDVLKAQTRRMLRDAKARGLAVEFTGNWLDFRRFEEHNSVDRQRFPSFTNELRQAMFEEPIRYFLDIAQHNRSVLDLLYGNDTFVNRQLARHYGIPELPNGTSEWVHVADARRYDRGGLLPMAVFLTKNAPGLRTSPVKRGYWVVRRLLGEQIPPPPPTVPELPKDEAKLGELTLPQVLARHRDNKACAGCHRRFDSVGLVFEAFGPIGERRLNDLGGHPVQTEAAFPDGKERKGLEGLRAYLREKRQDDFIENLCRKLFSYALGRGMLISDKKTLDEMQAKLAVDGYAFCSLVDSIVTSPQFLNKRGRDDPRRE